MENFVLLRVPVCGIYRYICAVCSNSELNARRFYRLDFLKKEMVVMGGNTIETQDLSSMMKQRLQIRRSIERNMDLRAACLAYVCREFYSD